MWAAPEGFSEALQHSQISKAVLWDGTRKVYDTSEGDDTLIFQKEGSKVTAQRQADIRRSASLSFVAPGAVGVDMLDPTSNLEIQMYSGALMDGEPHWIPVGRFNVDDWSVSGREGVYKISVNCLDRSAMMSASWRVPWQVTRDTNWYTAIRQVVQDRARGFLPTYNFGNTALLTPDLTYSEDSNPWTDVVLKMAEGAASEIYFEPDGTLYCWPIDDDEGVAPAMDLLAELRIVSPPSRNMKKSDIVNGVICASEAPWLIYPVSGEYWDDDPTSRTWRYGVLGERPERIGDNMAGTPEQCVTIAKAHYMKRAGIVESISFDMWPDPRFEPGDIVTAFHKVLQEKGRYSLDSFVFPFDLQVMQGTTRSKR